MSGEDITELPSARRDSFGGEVLCKLQDAFSAIAAESSSAQLLEEHQQQSNSNRAQKLHSYNKPQHRLEKLLEKYVTEDKDNHKENITASTSSRAEAPLANCRPWNYHDFLSRLHSFRKTQNWFAKPAELSALQAALHGWSNTGYNTLHCYACNANWKHEAAGPASDSTCLQKTHAETCEWRGTSCPDTFVNIPHFDDAAKLFEDFNQRLYVALQSLCDAAALFPIEGEASPGKLVISLKSVLSANKVVQQGVLWDELGLRADQDLVVERRDLQNAQLQAFANEHSLSNLLYHKRPFVERLLQYCDVGKSTVLQAAFVLALFGWAADGSGGVTCKLCCQDLSLADHVRKDKAVDVVSRHRHYCPWISEQLHCDGLQVGYELCQRTVLASVGTQLRNQLIASSPPSKARDDVHDRNPESVERVYKRIKLMLDAAAAPQVKGGV